MLSGLILSIKAEVELGLWLAGGRRQGWVCGRRRRRRRRDGMGGGVPFHCARPLQCVKSAERTGDRAAAAVRPVRSSPARDHHQNTDLLPPCRSALLLRDSSSPWAAWMWCTKCSVLSLISAPTAPTTTRYGSSHTRVFFGNLHAHTFFFKWSTHERLSASTLLIFSLFKNRHVEL